MEICLLKPSFKLRNSKKIIEFEGGGGGGGGGESVCAAQNEEASNPATVASAAFIPACHSRPKTPRQKLE
jgi:hypothetical protein